MFAKILLYASIFLIFVGNSCHAQGESTDVDPVEESMEEKPTAPTKVDIEPLARDDEIEERLTRILHATEWFRSPNVEVDEGVVFLRGEASNEKYRAWASDLAQKTQDVVAVVNRMSIQDAPIWDMSPAITEVRTLAATAIQSTPLFAFAAIVLVLTWPIAQAIKRLSDWILRKRIGNNLLRGVVAKATMLPVLLLGIYLVLRVSGLTQLALTVLGGTGIAGLIIGIAFRDIAENFLASILISTQNPFRTGDLVQVDEHIGFVQRVTTRGTLLMTFDGNHVQIPNATLYKTTITNYSANPNRRVEFVVGIGYDDSISQAMDIVKQVIDDHPNLVSEPKSRVILDQLGASTVNLKVYIWLDANKHSPDAVRSSVMRMVKQALLQAGVSLPDESREVIFPNQVPVRMVGDEESVPEQPALRESPRRDGYLESETVEQIVSVGEGDMESDAGEIQRQAEKSWAPEDGANLLEDTSITP